MYHPIHEEAIKERLSHIPDPHTGKDIVASGIVSGIVIKETRVGVMLTIDKARQQDYSGIQATIEQSLGTMAGIEKVTVVLTAQTDATSPETNTRPKAVWNITPLENVTKVIAVASGKGGVGKSTVTALLALSYARQGKRVGILDADIYGPSIPHMMGLADAGKPQLQGNRMLPFSSGGVQCMSIGFLLEPQQAAIMRGPMVSKTLHTLLRTTLWGEEGTPLDILFIDMPPGTGDVHLSMVQQIPLRYAGGGALIVTTPQEIALLDARKCVQMFHKTDVPLLGVIENMSYLEHPSTCEKIRIFGEGGGTKLAQEAGVPLLQELAIYPSLREAADNGALPDYVATMDVLPFMF
jgi:ATP-binding protein involved in chromosome partitioning